MLIWLLTILTTSTVGEAQDYGAAENLVIYPLPDVNFKHIQQAAGTSITLNCSLHDEQKQKHGFIWQKCSSTDQRWPMCSQWTDYCKNCSSNLHLNNITQRRSGIYRCKHDGTVLDLFHLEIKEPDRPPEPPEVSPTNLTVMEGMPAVLHCRVRSEQYVDLRWLLRRSATMNETEHIVYQGVHYKPLTSTGQVRQGTMYYTQLNIACATILDSGYYTCVVLSQAWSTAQDVQLTVVPNNMTDLALNYEESSWSLHLLFLIPAALALLPATAWLCCQWRRRFNKQEVPTLIQHSKYHPVTNNSFIHIR